MRTLDEAVRAQAKAAVEEIVEGMAAAFGVVASLDYRLGYPVLVNDAAEAAFCAEIAAGVVGAVMVSPQRRPEMGPRISPTCCRRGPVLMSSSRIGDGAGLHHPAYDYNDEATPIGASRLRAAGRGGAAACGRLIPFELRLIESGGQSGGGGGFLSRGNNDLEG